MNKFGFVAGERVPAQRGWDQVPVQRGDRALYSETPHMKRVTYRQTDMTEKITFPQLRWRAVKIQFVTDIRTLLFCIGE